MIQDRSIVAVIPARGGSKGVSRKNIRVLAGKPLIAWTIEEAKKSKYIDRLILSSEDQEIIYVAQKHGCEVPFTRPVELASDTCPGSDVILHAIEKCPGYSYVLLLQPTSPLRTVDHIDSFIAMFKEDRLNCAVSVTSSIKHPMWMFRMNEDNFLSPFFNGYNIPSNRQELPSAYTVNGALYMARIPWLKKNMSFFSAETKGFYMQPEKSIDIDTDMDFFICECILKKQ